MNVATERENLIKRIDNITLENVAHKVNKVWCGINNNMKIDKSITDYETV